MSQGPSIHASDPETVREMFTRIASRYDLTNALLSLGLYRIWNTALVRAVLCRAPTRVLDLCCGTGAIAHTLLQKIQGRTIQLTCADFCPGMLTHATSKLTPWTRHGHQLHYLCADAQNLPLPDASFDAVTLAYGIRNVARPELALAEAYRVLRSGGQLAILELTRPKNPFIAAFHRSYLKFFLPFVGFLTTRQHEAYRYLATSIQSFTDPVLLKQTMEEIGFERVEKRALFGGICTLLTGSRGKDSLETSSPIGLNQLI